MADFNESLRENDSTCIQLDEFLVDGENDITGKFSFRLVFISLYTLVFIFGISGNSAVVWLIASKKVLRSVRNVFIANLALADILVCLTSLPVSAYSLMYKRWIFGSALCATIPLCQGTSIFVGIFTLAAIAIDRFILICRPLQTPIQANQALLITGVIWLCGVLVSLPVALSYQLFPLGFLYEEVPHEFCGEVCQETWAHDSDARLYGIAVLVLQFLAPLVVITFCYVRIFYEMAARNQRHLTLVRVVEAERSRRQRRTNAILIAMVCLFVALWAPQVFLSNLLIDSGWLPTQFHYISSLLAHFLAMTSNITNPILYAWANGNFKEVLRSMTFNQCGTHQYLHRETRENLFKPEPISYQKHSNEKRCDNPANEKVALTAV